MTTIAIRLPDLEAVMRVVVQKVNKAYRDLQGLMQEQIRDAYASFKRAAYKALLFVKKSLNIQASLARKGFLIIQCVSLVYPKSRLISLLERWASRRPLNTSLLGLWFFVWLPSLCR